jgi:hypothetical protein
MDETEISAENPDLLQVTDKRYHIRSSFVAQSLLFCVVFCRSLFVLSITPLGRGFVRIFLFHPLVKHHHAITEIMLKVALNTNKKHGNKK